MNTTVVAVFILLLVGVGIYVGISNLAAQYGFEPSGGNAESVTCAPQTAEARLNQPVRFAASGATGAYYWASAEGRSEVTATGALEVRFPTAGQKTVYLFHAIENRWYRTGCSVLIR